MVLAMLLFLQLQNCPSVPVALLRVTGNGEAVNRQMRLVAQAIDRIRNTVTDEIG